MAGWEIAAKKKRDEVNALIPPSWRLPAPLPPPEIQKDVTGKFIQQFLTAREIEITEVDAVAVLAMTTTGLWTAQEVAEAFCHRAALSHQMVNCLHEIFFEAAISDAKKLDEYFSQNGKPLGPLHGLPISLKDQFHVKDVETTMGYVGWIGTFEGKKAREKRKEFAESELVRELRNMGAVLYCKTSVPHSLMAGETINNIIGYTWNPKNRLLSCGGSSGGEGALIGLKGSPLGLGTDIGGSIRIPACFNGLYGLKPSGGRLPYEGMATSLDGQNSILSVVGPLATSVRSLTLLMKSVLSQEPWLHDPLVAEIPWREQHREQALHNGANMKNLTFGVLWNDGEASIHPPVRRAIKIVVDAIENSGHEVIEWKPPSHKRGLEISHQIWMFDGGEDIHSAFELSGEPISRQISCNYGTLRSEQKNACEIAATNVAKRVYQKDYMDFWNRTAFETATGKPVDAVIMPLAPCAAARPGRYDYHGYSLIVNVLDYAASIIPVTVVDKKIDLFEADYKPFSELDERVWSSYDPEIYDGAHVGVQLVGRRLQEEKILGLTEFIANELRKLPTPGEI